jgi:hypothetical protein
MIAVAVRLVGVIAACVGVEVDASVSIGLGIGVAVGTVTLVCDTCTNIVAATSVRMGFKSRVGVGVGVLLGDKIPQADNKGRHRANPNAVIFLFLFAIWPLLY